MSGIRPQIPSAAVIWLGWASCGAALLIAAVQLTLSAPRFAYGQDLAALPSRELAVGLVCAGAVFASVVWLVRASVRAGLGDDRRLLAFMLLAGLAFRLVLWPSTPALEDDYYRYLWDGAVVAHGWNPYAVSPDAAQGDEFAGSLQALAHRSGVIIERINHPDLKTIYPPGAEALFGLAHIVTPFDVTGWRVLVLIGDLATLGFILALLGAVKRPALWAAVYWWNPVAVKELANSIHMEAVLMPFVLAAVLLAIRARPVSASALLGLAMTIKIWPVVLAPVLLRRHLGEARIMGMAAFLLTLAAFISLAPLYASGGDETAGLRAYATRWQTNSALTPLLATGFHTLLAPWGIAENVIQLAVRGLLALVFASIALALVWRPRVTPAEITSLVTLTILALLLLSPAQFPWYALWVLPFAALHPWRGMIALTVLIPIYYLSFHHLANGTYDLYKHGIVWGIWVPVWLAFLWDAARGHDLAMDGTRAHA